MSFGSVLAQARLAINHDAAMIHAWKAGEFALCVAMVAELLLVRYTLASYYPG